jgi:hypothetical protein
MQKTQICVTGPRCVNNRSVVRLEYECSETEGCVGISLFNGSHSVKHSLWYYWLLWTCCTVCRTVCCSGGHRVAGHTVGCHRPVASGCHQIWCKWRKVTCSQFIVPTSKFKTFLSVWLFKWPSKVTVRKKISVHFDTGPWAERSAVWALADAGDFCSLTI